MVHVLIFSSFSSIGMPIGEDKDKILLFIDISTYVGSRPYFVFNQQTNAKVTSWNANEAAFERRDKLISILFFLS